MAGLPTTQGVKVLAEAIVPGDAPVVERMRACGAIPFARTNLPDLGLRVHTDSGLHGLTRNPWNYDRTVAGSSGGEAASLASGMSPFGLGNDLGGSLRNPANAAGICSIKPSFGRVPAANYLPPQSMGPGFAQMAVQGVMARTVRDVRRGLEAVMGAHPRDPLSISAPLVGPEVPKRVLLCAEPAGSPTHSRDCSRGATSRRGTTRAWLCRGRRRTSRNRRNPANLVGTRGYRHRRYARVP